jgi:hypothetical protein
MLEGVLYAEQKEYSSHHESIKPNGREGTQGKKTQLVNAENRGPTKQTKEEEGNKGQSNDGGMGVSLYKLILSDLDGLSRLKKKNKRYL